MATLLIGYDVEAQEPEITGRFLKKAGEVHRALKMPCTMFLVGKTLEKNINNCQDLTENELIDFQQHTYSHMLLKCSPSGIAHKALMICWRSRLK